MKEPGSYCRTASGYNSRLPAPEFAVLISSAYAQAGGQPGFDGFQMILLFGIMGIFLFITFRSQAKRAKEHKQLMESLQKGDEVVAAGGLVGRITRLTDQYAVLEIAPNTEIVVQKAGIQVALPKGTIKSIQ